MKFWELISALRGEPSALQQALSMGEWTELREWYESFDSIVAQQDRAKLDAEVPEALVQAVADRSRQLFCLADGTLRSSDTGTQGNFLSAREVVDRFGGSSIEEVNERGSAVVG